jgi:hypothetical protein
MLSSRRTHALELTSLNREERKGREEFFTSVFKTGKTFCLPSRPLRLCGKDLFPVEKNCIL